MKKNADVEIAVDVEVDNGKYVKLDDYDRLMLRCTELEDDARRYNSLLNLIRKCDHDYFMSYVMWAKKDVLDKLIDDLGYEYKAN